MASPQSTQETKRSQTPEKEEIEKDDFEMAQYYANMATFYSTKHSEEYTGDLEYLSLTNEPMEIETVID
jgi:hypothetical protein